jgi:sugar lactone lactonase YvrE
VSEQRIRPSVWRPPPAPPRAHRPASETTFELRIIDIPGFGPEDVVVDDTGGVLTGVDDGRILRIDRDGGTARIADTGGRPLGIEIAPGGTELIVCDSERGLLRVPLNGGEIEVLVSEVDGEPLLFCNNATVARDGTVYFTDSSRHFRQDAYRDEMLAHTDSGRLFRRLPAGTVEEIADGLSFANGVTMSPDEDYVLVAETAGYRIQRVWLAGPRAGERETFVDNLPGFPDNLSTAADGLFWVALPSARNRLLDFLLPRSPALRRAIWAMPRRLQPEERRTVWVQAYDRHGIVVHDLQMSHPRFTTVTGVRESAGRLFLGSIASAGIGYLEVPARP